MRRHFPLLLGLLVSTSLLPACATKLEPTVNFDPSAEFSSRDNFAWVTDKEILRNAEGAEKRIYNADNERMLRDAIELELTSRGMVKVDREQASTLVHFFVATKEVQSVSAAGGQGYGMTWSDQSERARYIEGTLMIVLFDAQTNREIWSGSISKSLLGGKDPKEVIDMVVAAILEDFPPGG